MEFKELEAQVASGNYANKKSLRQIIQLVSLGGAIKPLFLGHLARAHDVGEFFRLIFDDDDLRMEMAWSKIATDLFPDEFLNRFNHIDSYTVPVVDGKVTLEALDGSTSASVNVDGDVAKVLVFKDGAINETLFTNSRQIGFDTECGSRSYPAPLSLHSFRDTVVIVPWVLDEMGERASRRYKMCIS